MKNIRSCWSMAEQGLKIFRTCIRLCHRREENQGRMYFLKKEDMNISREQKQMRFAIWTEIHNRSEANQALSQRNIPKNFLMHPFLSFLHFKISRTERIWPFCLFSAQPTNTKLCLVRINLPKSHWLQDPGACVTLQSDHSGCEML